MTQATQVLEDGQITERELEMYLREAEALGAHLNAFGKTVRSDGTQL